MFQLVVQLVESFSEFMVLRLNVVELLLEFVVVLFELLVLLLFLIFVIMEFILDLLVVFVEMLVLFFPVATFLDTLTTEFHVVSSLFSVMRHGNLHLVNIHSHFVLFLNSLLPFFNHTVFALKIDVGLVLKESNSFLKLVNSVLIETVHALHVLESLVHDSGVRALVREFEADLDFFFTIFKN